MMYKISKKNSEDSIKLGKKITGVVISFYIFGLLISLISLHGIYAWGRFVLVDDLSEAPEDSFLLYLVFFIFGLWILSIPLKKITIFRINGNYDLYLGKSLIKCGGNELQDILIQKEFEKKSLKAISKMGFLHSDPFVVLRTNNGYINFAEFGILGFQISKRTEEKLSAFLKAGPDY